MNQFSKVLKAFESSGCRYAIVGGFAVVMHGSNRFTPDVNVVLDYADPKVSIALDNLMNAGLAACSPEALLSMKDPAYRKAWLENDKWRFLSFQDPQVAHFSVEVFMDSPMPLEELLATSQAVEMGEISTRICSLPHLIEMKIAANRPQDKLDLEQLRLINEWGDRLLEPTTRKALQNEPPEGFNEDRLLHLFDFLELSPEERLSWLNRMLMEIGGLCLV